MTLAAMLNPSTTATAIDSQPASNSSDPPQLVVKSTEVLRGRTEIWIEHGSEMYRLRLTRADKLLLCK